MTDKPKYDTDFILGQTKHNRSTQLIRHMVDILNEHTIMIYGLCKKLNVSPTEIVELAAKQGVVNLADDDEKIH